MSILFREKDQTLYRDYLLIPNGNAIHFQTRKATVDIVDTKEYGPMFFIDGVLQASIFDEYIYHEFLVHIPMSYAQSNTSICILGGGDGCAAREVLKWKTVQTIDLYDWDLELVDYFRTHGTIWNHGSLKNPTVSHEHTDVSALFLNSEIKRYDVILVDLLDPEYSDLQGKDTFWIKLLYLVKRWRKQGGSIIINAGGVSPWQTGCFFLLKQLCKSVFPELSIIPYKVFVPSFGREWAFLLIVETTSQCKGFPTCLRRLNDTTFCKSSVWEPDFKIDE
jgi:spermidine synthase